MITVTLSPQDLEALLEVAEYGAQEMLYDIDQYAHTYDPPFSRWTAKRRALEARRAINAIIDQKRRHTL